MWSPKGTLIVDMPLGVVARRLECCSQALSVADNDKMVLLFNIEESPGSGMPSVIESAATSDMM